MLVVLLEKDEVELSIFPECPVQGRRERMKMRGEIKEPQQCSDTISVYTISGSLGHCDHTHTLTEREAG